MRPVRDTLEESRPLEAARKDKRRPSLQSDGKRIELQAALAGTTTMISHSRVVK